jgi:hypothetical protein
MNKKGLFKTLVSTVALVCLMILIMLFMVFGHLDISLKEQKLDSNFNDVSEGYLLNAFMKTPVSEKELEKFDISLDRETYPDLTITYSDLIYEMCFFQGDHNTWNKYLNDEKTVVENPPWEKYVKFLNSNNEDSLVTYFNNYYQDTWSFTIYFYHYQSVNGGVGEIRFPSKNYVFQNLADDQYEKKIIRIKNFFEQNQLSRNTASLTLPCKRSDIMAKVYLYQYEK